MALSFGTRVLLTIGGACVVCTSAAILVARDRIQDNGERALVEKSQAILSRLEVGRDFVANMGILDSLIEESVKKHPDGELPKEQKVKVLKGVPIFAAMKLGQTGAEKENYKFRIFDDNARNSENKATEQEQVWLNRFEAEPSLNEIVETSGDGAYKIVVRPVRVTQSEGCLICHGHPSTSPWKNGKDVLGYKMENMKDGDLKGAFAVVSSLEPVRAQTQAATSKIVLWGVGFTLIALAIAFLVVRAPVRILNEIASKLAGGASEMVNTSEEIRTSSTDLEDAVKLQAQALQETVVSVDEINSTVTHNADNVEKSRAVTKKSMETIHEGKSTVEAMMKSIEEISSSNQEISSEIERSNSEIAEITRVIGEIGEKTRVINDIVFQTKLLSFNASVEAARAGEHGKGFSVVAEEVGNLAQMSGNAAKEISGMLEESIRKVESIIDGNRRRTGSLISANGEKVRAGTVTAERCGEVLDRILEQSNEVNTLFETIAVSSRQQAQGVSEISQAMSKLDSVTHRTTTASQQTATAGDQVGKQSDDLRGIVIELARVVRGEDKVA